MTRHYDLSVTLDEADPPVWRRFLLAAEATFADLHRAIQDACGWQNYHLYEFSRSDGTPLAGLPDTDDWRDELPPDAGAVRIATFFDEHDFCRYVYDFGDHWQHTVRREAVVDGEEGFHRRLVDGARAFPPEDCGGIPGYEQCVAVAGGQQPEQVWVDVGQLRQWLGAWDPDGFDLAAAQAAFDRAAAPGGPTSPFAPSGFSLPPPSALPTGIVPPDEKLQAMARANPVLSRLDAFVAWIGPGRTLTGTGNLTRADGRQLIDVLGTDDAFDEQIGERVFKTKSTVELRGVDYAFRLARTAGFVKVRKGSVSATRRGQALGDDPLADWHAAFAGLLKLGVLGHRYAYATFIDPYWKELVDEQVPGLLAHLLLADAPVAIDELHARLWALVESSFVLDDLDEQQLHHHRDMLERDVRSICTSFADLGALSVDEVEVVTTIHGTEREAGGQVRVSPLGVAGVHRLVAG